VVDKLATRFLDTEGDLKELAKALVPAPDAWAAPREKLKARGEWIVAALRATGATPPDIRPVLQAHNLLGAPLWRPPAPKGFPDDSAAWMDGLAERLDVANQFARRVAPLVDPEGAVDLSLGPLASAETRQAVGRAVALLLMAPEFLRSDVMPVNLHAPSRREVLLASGVLFAWAHLPRAARAEGRDPRFLVIILRGALDGLATVAPVGDRD